jgi:hypothetical protein
MGFDPVGTADQRPCGVSSGSGWWLRLLYFSAVLPSFVSEDQTFYRWCLVRICRLAVMIYHILPFTNGRI